MHTNQIKDQVLPASPCDLFNPDWWLKTTDAHEAYRQSLGTEEDNHGDGGRCGRRKKVMRPGGTAVQIKGAYSLGVEETKPGLCRWMRVRTRPTTVLRRPTNGDVGARRLPATGWRRRGWLRRLRQAERRGGVALAAADDRGRNGGAANGPCGRRRWREVVRAWKNGPCGRMRGVRDRACVVGRYFLTAEQG
ncbi:hypothetical protein VPH35_066147 [Triticum aestivum]